VSLGQLVENYDDPVYSAAERLIDPVSPHLRPSSPRQPTDNRRRRRCRVIAGRQSHRHHVAAASHHSQPNARYRTTLSEVHYYFNATSSVPA